MNRLTDVVGKLRLSPVNEMVRTRMSEFSAFYGYDDDMWFSELCFCLLTANSKAKTAIAIQNNLGPAGFINCSAREVCSCIRRNKHRFHNIKAGYIIDARTHKCGLKETVIDLVDNCGQPEAREWLVENVKGLGFKEASHFLRNVGFFDLAILDRHIINLLFEHKYLGEKPKSLTKKSYLLIEKKFRRIADSLDMQLAELDMYMWYMKTGEVLK